MKNEIGQGQVKFKLILNNLKFRENNSKIVTAKAGDTQGSKTALFIYLFVFKFY